VLFTGLGNSYQLADIGVVPEPSRAMLGLLGLGALVFRRRR
jgi:MYXO-CTERM domain-containing protein